MLGLNRKGPTPATVYDQWGLPSRPLPDDLAEHDRLDRNDPNVRSLLRKHEDGHLTRSELERQVHDYRERTARRHKADAEAIEATQARQREASRCRACGRPGVVYDVVGAHQLCEQCRMAAEYLRGQDASMQRLPDGRLRGDAVLRYLARVEAEASSPATTDAKVVTR